MKTIGQKIRELAGPTLAVLGAIALAAISLNLKHPQFHSLTPNWMLLITGACLSLAAVVLIDFDLTRLRKSEGKATEKAQRLSKQNLELKQKIIDGEERSSNLEQKLLFVVESHLKLLLESAGLSTSERCTLYVRKPDGFLAIARWSKNPKWMSCSNKPVKTTGGLLDDAWQHGTAQLAGLPDPSRWLDKYLKAQTSTGLTKTSAKALRMRSRAYSIFRVEDTAGNPIGLLSVESIQDQPLTAVVQPHMDAIKPIVSHAVETIVSESIEPIGSDLLHAKGQGF